MEVVVSGKPYFQLVSWIFIRCHYFRKPSYMSYLLLPSQVVSAPSLAEISHWPSKVVGHVRVLFDRIIRVEQVIGNLIRKISLANESSLTKQRATALVFDEMLCGVSVFVNSLADPLTLVYPHLLEPLVGPELFTPNI